MGNKILGKRSRSFYKGFNERQIDYLQQKFETFSKDGSIEKQKFKKAYHLTDGICSMFFQQVDFDEDSSIDEYQFICAVHSLCSCTIEELGRLFFKILTHGSKKLDEKNLLAFTSTCLKYNSYLEKKLIKDIEVKAHNDDKFRKFDFDKNGVFDQGEFTKMCLKDEDYKKWMYNMGFITRRQLDFQEDYYDLIDSDIADEVDRHRRVCDQNTDKIKKGIEHRLEDEEFQMEEEEGQQSVNIQKPWRNDIKKCKVGDENPQSPSQTLQIDYVFGYRSYDCRNNVKFDAQGRIIYHQAAIGIVMNPKTNNQVFITEHHDDISCLDVVGNYAVTGEVGSKPEIIMWETDNSDDGVLDKQFIVTAELKDSVGNVCLSHTRKLLAAVCNDENHTLVIYSCEELLAKQKDPLLEGNGVIGVGSVTKNIVFDIKFALNEKRLAVATLREIIFVTFDKGALNANRGDFGNFTVSGAMCLLALDCEVNHEKKQLMLSGMGNGSVYFWDEEKCVRAVSGHTGSVSALAVRNDCKSFVSGDKTGKIIVWNSQLKKESTVTIPKTNCPSNMIVSLSTYGRQMLVGTKASDIFLTGLSETTFDNAKKIMSGHNDGRLNALTLHKVEPFLYTGGDDKRLMKWDYVRERALVKERKCAYAIRCMDIHSEKNLLVVGYTNGVIQCFKADSLDRTEHSFKGIKNPDQETLNLVRINKDGNLCAACYQLPEFKIVLLAMSENKMKVISEIGDIKAKVLALDFDKNTSFLRFNTENYDYLVYDLNDLKKPAKTKADAGKQVEWATHTLPFSPETQGIMTEGVTESDIICCERSRKYRNVFVVGDRYSKIKLFNYPSVSNPIFNRYVGHSNEVSGLQFNRDEKYLVSIGSEEKSIIVWKYDPVLVENQWFIDKLAPESDLEEKEINEERKKKAKVLDQFAVENEEGEQALAVKPFLGQIKPPSDFRENYNPRKDNQLPKQDVKIKHVFGLRNKYLNDEVRNQCKFSSDYKHVLFPTACLGVKMSVEDKTQEFFHQHKEDIVSFAIDDKRRLMATGQMAEKNPYAPRKKILSIYVWDIDGNKMLQKLDGFHTIAVVLLSFSPNSKFLFSCGNDDKNTFAVYDWMSGSIIYTGPTSRAKVNGIAWKNDNEFATCGMDHVKFWTGKKGTLGKITGKTESMFSVVSSKSIYVTGSGNGGIFNWIGNTSSKKIDAHKGKVHTLVSFKEYVYSGGDDGKILAWRVEPNGQIRKYENFFDTRMAFQQMLKEVSIKEEEFGVLSIDFTPKKEMLVATKGASVILKSGNNAQVIHQGHYRGQLWGLTTNINRGEDSLIITAGDDKTVRVWDIKNRRELNRVYFDHKVRGIDWSSDGDKVVVADARSKLFMYAYGKDKLIAKGEYTGKPYDFNAKQKIDPWVEEIKFSPNNQMIAYGCHGKSMYMQFVNVNGYDLKVKKAFAHGGSSAVLHLDWSTDSSTISLNTQDYSLLFITNDGGKMTASSTIDTRWKTWTQKFGFPVQGVFQGVDYSDCNTVCRDPTERFMAAGYDDQCIRLFKWPCYIDKQVCKTFTGHSSHVTRVKFTKSKMVSVGGLDRTIIVWDIEDPDEEIIRKENDSDDDGLDDLDADVDVPNKALRKKKKEKAPEEFYEIEDEGDEFMAVKPWLGAIKEPTYGYPKQTTKAPKASIELEYVHGYRCKDCRQNLYYSDKDTLIFHAAAVVITHLISRNDQILETPHNDDILSIDYHKKTNQVITGELGPKPMVCLFRNGKLDKTFAAPVRKGVLAIAISPDGSKAACAGMDDDHYVAVMDLDSGKVLASMKGSKKVIMKIVWTSNSQFVTAGIKLYKCWSINGKTLKSTGEGRDKGNYVSIAFDADTGNVYTGESKGMIKVWKQTSSSKPIILTHPTDENKNVSVVDSLLVQKEYLLAGTKDGFLFVLDKTKGEVLNTLNMAVEFQKSGVNSEYPSVRAMDIIDRKLIVGTLGSEIYELEFDDLTKKVKKIKSCKNIIKGHFSPNNTWTNEVWGLHVSGDYIFTCSDDATVRCWSIGQKKLLSCESLNVNTDGSALAKDKRTNDYCDSAKGRAVAVSPDLKTVVVGSKNGTVRVYSFDQGSDRMYFKSMFRHAKEWISDIKFAHNTLIIGSHDDRIYVYDYKEQNITRRFRPMKKHSSYITHFDVSRDSCFLQSTCGAYQLLFWDLSSGKQITSGASMLRDERWASWTCNLGWPVQGIYPKCTDGTFINAVDRSNFSLYNTRYQDEEDKEQKTPYLLAAGNDNGKVAIYNFPTTIKSSHFVQGRGHSSHVTNVRWSNDDSHVVSVGGEDQCLMYWKVKKNL